MELLLSDTFSVIFDILLVTIIIFFARGALSDQGLQGQSPLAAPISAPTRVTIATKKTNSIQQQQHQYNSGTVQTGQTFQNLHSDVPSLDIRSEDVGFLDDLDLPLSDQVHSAKKFITSFERRLGQFINGEERISDDEGTDDGISEDGDLIMPPPGTRGFMQVKGFVREVGESDGRPISVKARR